eukprot:scaffold31955_cov190-Skeletonema_marinoi.AAC.1
MADYNGSLEAVDCHIYSVRYDMVLESSAGGRLRWPHQVTYDVVAKTIRSKRASAVIKMLLYYHGRL